MRGQLRQAWTNHPTKNSYITHKRYKAPLGKPTKKEPNGKMVFTVDCELCEKPCKVSYDPKKGEEKPFNVDHLIGGKGFKNLEEMMGWIERIFFITSDDIRILCTPCHKIINHSQKTGLNFEHARADKQAIKIQNEKTDKEFIEEAGETPGSNAKIRRKQLVQILMQKNEESL